MAAKKAFKSKDDLDALLQEATSLLGEKEISRKRRKGRSDLEFYRDSTTGLRKYKHKYRPREKKVTNTSLCSATVKDKGGNHIMKIFLLPTRGMLIVT